MEEPDRGEFQTGVVVTGRKRKIEKRTRTYWSPFLFCSWSCFAVSDQVSNTENDYEQARGEDRKCFLLYQSTI